jgi:AcrR family transcriptional regulator
MSTTAKRIKLATDERGPADGDLETKQAQRLAKQSPSATARRVDLLDATVAQIALRGTRGMRVEEVARAAGVSTALLYHHFADRSALLVAALQHVGDRANVYTEPKGKTARGRLINLLRGEVQDDLVVRTNSAAWGELRDSAIFDESLRPILAKQTLRWIDDIADLVKDGHRDGSVGRSVNPTTAGIRLSALVEGLSSRWLAGLLTTTQTRRHITDSAQTLLGPERVTPTISESSVELSV